MAAREEAARRRALSAEGMARVRVYTRTGSGKKAAMVGLIPRETLEEIRSRLVAASGSGARRCRLAARVKKLEVVQVSVRGGAEVVKGRRLLLGVSIRADEPLSRGSGPSGFAARSSVRAGSRTRVVERELAELVLEADRIKNASPKRELAGA